MSSKASQHPPCGSEPLPDSFFGAGSQCRPLLKLIAHKVKSGIECLATLVGREKALIPACAPDRKTTIMLQNQSYRQEQVELLCLKDFQRIKLAKPPAVCNAIVKKRNPKGEIYLGYCYAQAFAFLLDLGLMAQKSAPARRILPRSWLVHGTRPNGGGHAWVELPGEVIFDGVYQRFCAKRSYYRVQKARAYQKFRPGAAFMLMEHLIRTDLGPIPGLAAKCDSLLLILVALTRRDTSEKLDFNWWHRFGFHVDPRRPVVVDEQAATKLVSTLNG